MFCLKLRAIGMSAIPFKISLDSVNVFCLNCHHFDSFSRSQLSNVIFVQFRLFCWKIVWKTSLCVFEFLVAVHVTAGKQNVFVVRHVVVIRAGVLG